MHENEGGRVDPAFTSEDAVEYFHTLYEAQPKTFTKPTCMPLPKLPTEEFDTDPIQEWEIIIQS